MHAVPPASQASQSPGLAFRETGRARASLNGFIWSFVNVATSVLLTALVFLVTSRVLAPTEFGAVALASAIVALVGSLVPVAFGDALVQRSDLRPQHVNSVFWLTAVLAVLACAALVMISPFFAEILKTPILASILPVLSLRLVFDAVLTVPGSLIQRRMQFRHIALRTTLANGIGAALCLWMVLEGYAIWALVFSQITTSIAALIVTLWVANWMPGFAISRAALAELRNFGLFAMGGRILNVARLDQLLLGVVLGPHMLGLYFFACRVHRMLCDVTSGAFAPVANVMFASLQRESEKRRDFYLAACFASASLAFPVFAGLIAIAPSAVPLVFGPQWVEAVFAVQCFAVIGLMTGLGTMQAGLIRYLGQPGWWFGYQMTMQFSTILVILFLHPLGLNVVMAAMVVRTMLLWPFSVRKAQRLLNIRAVTYLGSIAGPSVSALAMAVFVASFSASVEIEGQWTFLLAQLFGGAVVYAASLVLLSHRRLGALILIYRRGRDQA